MSRLVGSQTIKGIVTSYFGDMDILDDQMAFDKGFDKCPTIVGTRPASGNNVSCMSRVRNYADGCLLDVFLEVYREDYVGRADTNARKKVVLAIYKTISEITQARKGPWG